eukprot:TRINITY_DN813_c0_g1_i11.p1 TRINITY_DN813_c0_g1~~TRINITY_DN813_c0_g1_i11.p1  ORF type:complete len:148 (+),score=23.72 TRINITY_DN813_c0_g1_i11:49-444(+)
MCIRDRYMGKVIKRSRKNQRKMCEVYRSSKLGVTLTECLRELETNNKISKDLSQRIMKKFDVTIYKFLKQHKGPKGNIKAHLSSYNNCDNTWKLRLRGVNLNVDNEKKPIHSMMIYAVKSELLDIDKKVTK